MLLTIRLHTRITLLLFAFFTTIVSSCTHAQVGPNDFIRVFNETIRSNNVAEFKRLHFDVIFKAYDWESLISKNEKDGQVSVKLTKAKKLKDLEAVKVKSVGKYSSLYEYYRKRTLTLQEYDNYETSLNMLRKYKPILLSITNVHIYTITYPYMDFEIFIKDKMFKIISDNNAGWTGIIDDDDPFFYLRQFNLDM